MDHPARVRARRADATSRHFACQPARKAGDSHAAQLHRGRANRGMVGGAFPRIKGMEGLHRRAPVK